MQERTLLFIPMYNCAAQIGRVIRQLTPEVQAHLAGVLVVDNRSTDNGADVAVAALGDLAIPATLVRNDANYGLGGSHKVAFQHALAGGYDYLVVLHGDDQGSIADLLPLLERRAHENCDALLGARFMQGARLEGYSPARTLGNHVFNLLYSAALRQRVHDLGSGLNLYRVAALKDKWWYRNADDLTFNYHMLLRSYAAGWRICYFPLSWREDDQVSNVKLFRQATRVASLPLLYALRRRRYLETDFSKYAPGQYTSSVQASLHG
ncbi:glycosyltransferase family 2 protein [Sphingosinithalassobacter sp. CS137]|uniref:glycosyltransferase family 2 protein n=1 Tax=Sphingosinithalassobacter sp. CS137 TaxID=2762748 RepID=UPI00165E9EA3|nr:glycosyltransferase family 2 protein [Sphingosinithalassobacter sp. CS137]